jgi:hypothetical protein
LMPFPSRRWGSPSTAWSTSEARSRTKRSISSCGSRAARSTCTRFLPGVGPSTRRNSVERLERPALAASRTPHVRRPRRSRSLETRSDQAAAGRWRRRVTLWMNADIADPSVPCRCDNMSRRRTRGPDRLERRTRSATSTAGPASTRPAGTRPGRALPDLLAIEGCLKRFA